MSDLNRVTGGEAVNLKRLMMTGKIGGTGKTDPRTVARCAR